MGTDIHMIVQRRQGTAWLDVDPPAWFERDEFLVKYSPRDWFSDRNYDAFGILANVRNGYGFAGCETGEALIPITGEAEQRGLPEGLTPAQRERLGDHSFHWLTLRELADYPHWGKQRLTYGVVTSEQYHKEIKGKRTRVNEGPSEYCGGVMGRNVRTFDEAEYLAVGAPVDSNTYVRIKWPETYAYSAATWFTKFLPALRRWADENEVAYTDVRIVFGFDS